MNPGIRACCKSMFYSLVCYTLFSCKQSFNIPELYPDPELTANCTIKDLKLLHTRSGQFDKIEEDRIVCGIVVADDRSGNFYKNIVVQDSTGGIMICINNTSLYTDYPVGRRVFIKAKGLLLGDYRGLMQLGADIDMSDPSDLKLAGVAASLAARYIVKGSPGHVITPVVVTPEQLTTAMQNSFQNTLIQLNDMELGTSDTGTAYASVKALLSRTVPVHNCAGDTLFLRNSAYAGFASYAMPSGRGTLTGVFTVFGSSRQLVIRDTSDVQFAGVRCNNGEGTHPDPTDTAHTVTGISLGNTSPLAIDFNGIGSGLPAGVTVRTGVTSTDTGVAAVFTTAKASWSSTGGGFKNYASATSMSSAATATAQANATNRAPGVRQVTATDKGIAFEFLLNNSSGKKSLRMRFLLQSPDASVSRSSTWVVDYAAGRNPSRFIPVVTQPVALTTGNGVFNSTAVSVVFPASLDNLEKEIRIRVAVHAATSGSGSRAVTAIDDVFFEWE